MRNVDHVVEVLFIIKQKSMKKCCQVIKTKLLFLIQFLSYSFLYYYIACYLYYKNFSVTHSTVFINNVVDVRHFTVYIVCCSIYIK